MARHTTWRAGGNAERFFRPADRDDLCRFLAALPPDEPLYWVGLGSNLLVRDGGIRGTVISTAGLNRWRVDAGAHRIRAEAGVASAKVARLSAEHGLAGAEFLAGIPGSFGGALAMNAGAFGGETWERVVAVETVDRNGTVHRHEPEAYEVDYRHVAGPAEQWFLAGTLQLQPGVPADGKARIRSLLERRGQHQPIGRANAGSVFRNPPGDHAARLIETAGMKGVCEGRACVSDVHANFIINTGGASAAEIETLIGRVRAAVLETHGVALEPEVRIVGEAP